MNISDPQHVDAVVIGGGMAGLVAAWQFTQEGLHPVLVESRGYTGGLIARSTLAGISYDIGAEGGRSVYQTPLNWPPSWD